MKPRILLVGKRGQIGSELNILLPPLGEVIALDHSQVDLSRKAELRDTIRSVRPDVIVNAAAYTAVDEAESHAAEARAVNTEAPGIMAEEAKAANALLIHYSTDYVFDGKSGNHASKAIPRIRSMFTVEPNWTENARSKPHERAI